MKRMLLPLLGLLMFAAPVVKAQDVVLSEEQIASYLTDLSKQLEEGEPDRSQRVSFGSQKVEKVGTSTESHWDVSFGPNGLVLTFLYDEKSLKSGERLVTDLAFGSGMARDFSGGEVTSRFWYPLQGDFFDTSVFEFAELLVNAQRGNPAAQARVAALVQEVTETIEIHPDGILGKSKIEEKIELLSKTRIVETRELEKKALEFQRSKNKSFENWKSQGLWEKLEQEPEKLEDLLLKNDRKGVAKLIRSYLPWTVMEPIETDYWKTWLEAIEHPDAKKEVIAFRGVDYDTDKIQRKQTGKGEVYGFFSTLLTKNQGSYTRRLRSLSTKRIKTGDAKRNAGQAEYVSVAQQMWNHSGSPFGSNFLSFSIDPNTAVSFQGTNDGKKARGGFLAVSIDSRRMAPNMSSSFSTEFELLVPLIVFPDEIIRYHEGEISEKVALQKFVDEAYAKKGKTSMQMEIFRSFGSPQLKAVNEAFDASGIDFMKTIATTPGRHGGLCSHVY